MNRTFFFFNFVFLFFRFVYLRDSTYESGSPAMQHVGPVTGENRRTLFRRCKKAAPERINRLTDFTSKSKNLPKKVHFFLERGPGEGSLPAAWALEIDGF